MVSRFSRSKIPSAGQKTKIRRRERANHKSLAKERPDLVRQWHRSKNLPLTPSDVTAGMETYVWWKCPKGPDHVWRAKVLARAYRGSACPFCANRQVSVKSSLAVLAPKVAQEWHESKNGSVGPAEVVPGSGKMAWWRCRFGHEWRATIVQRTRVGTGCPSCSGRQVTPDRTLAVVAPAVARTWHPSKNGARKPSDVASGSGKKAWWLCKHGHEWRAAINARARRGAGCPMCSGHQVSPERSLAAVASKLAATWHATRNGRLRPEAVTPGSGRKVWWQCPKSPDHEWKTSVGARCITGCPFCSNHRVCRTNSLATVNRAVASEWHPTKNGKLRPSDVVHGCSKQVWWQCERGHEWFASISYRTLTGAGCPGCRFDGQLRRRLETGRLRPIDRALLAIPMRRQPATKATKTTTTTTTRGPSERRR